ncbi:Aldehyde oxidase [Lachnellula subtilissima]|uniref:Aldehyde oxidase n=1 Tax=Lachnellula subtilissima TaxID=602034 RepID=A0A8H8U5T9_9HELO|nr:Aldehyde oxidase [Lachnellula subtilissima]
MKTTTILSLAFAATACANIVINHVPLTCDRKSSQIYHGCLRGQVCMDDGSCMASKTIDYPISFRPVIDNMPRDAPVYSTDGYCGPNFNNTICDPHSKAYSGGCCSQYGFCGNTDSHCGDGCVSGCKPRPDGQCGVKFGGSTCDPKDGVATTLVISDPQPTSTPAEPIIGPVSTTTVPGATATGVVTTDGSCGTSNNNTVCGNWPNGNCCSMYGFCGSTSAHCGAGCQSGNCLNAPAVAAPGPSPAPPAPNGGSFALIGQSGVPAMHAALMPNGRVMILDKLENYTQIKNADGFYAMSSEYDPATNKVVPLAYLTNAFCSGGVFLADGRVVSLGGNAPLLFINPNIGDGFNAIRYLSRSATDANLDGQSWSEPGNKLASNRWYATAQTMPDGTVFVASGSLNGFDPTVLSNNNPTYEILNPEAVSQGKNIPLAMLTKNQPYYMYPFVHLLRDGTLFLFVAKASQIFDVGSNTVIKELPDLIGDYRTYPNTGGNVLLPLSSANNWEPEIIICGGGAYQDINSPTDPSCGRIQPLSTDPKWEMDSMPAGRGMVEGTLLPDGTIVWLNGGNRGAQGFGLMKDPELGALMYDPSKPLGQRFTTLAISAIPRLYHSVALLLLDGTLMVTGSNPVEMPILTPSAQNPFVTEFRVEQYVPPYLQGENANRRPTNVNISSHAIKADGRKFVVTFNAPANAQKGQVVLYHGGFVTHSVHMGHRMLELDNQGWLVGGAQQSLTVFAPPNNNVAPPGPYVVYVMVDGVPAMGQFVQIS